MKNANLGMGVVAGCGLLLSASSVWAVDLGARERTHYQKLTVGPGDVSATRPEKRDSPFVAQVSSPDKALASPRQSERKIAFEMRDKPWIGDKGSVLEWLSDQSGLPVGISSAKPTGTLIFMNPRVDGASKQYTLAEVIDILNGELFKQKLILVRRAKTLSVEPADDKIDPAILPRVSPGELDQYGDTELVSVVFPLVSLVAEDFANEVKGMLGPFGMVQPLAQANKVVVQDTVANLKRIRAIVKDSQDTEKTQSVSFSHTCQYIQARQAERILRDLLGDPKELLRARQPQLPFGEGFGGQFGGQFGTPLGLFQAAPANGPRVRMHYISVDERSNTVLVMGPADKIAQAEAILKKIDVPQPRDQKPVLVGPSALKTYPVAGGNAELLAKNLQEIYKNVPGIRIAAVSNHAIMVWAGPSDRFEILAHIRGSREQTGTLEVIPLASLDAADVVDTLKGMFGSDTKNGAPFLKADTARNAVVAKGTPEQMTEIKFALKALGEGSAPPLGGTVRILTIEPGSAAPVAETLKRMLPELLQNPVQVSTPGGSERKSSEPRKSESPPER